MTLEEVKEFLEERKAEGESEEDILKVLYAMYVKGAIELSDLRTFTEALGWKFTDEFEALPEDWVCPLCSVGKEDFEVVE